MHTVKVPNNLLEILYRLLSIQVHRGLSRDANSPAFGRRLTLFGLVSRSPALVPKSPAFYVHYQYRKWGR